MNSSRITGRRRVAPVILVVDDHPDTRTLITRTLQRPDYAVITVADGEAALAAAAVQFPDLVIADVFLPHISGLDVIHRLRQQDARLPAIALSAIPEVLEHPEVMPAGLDLASFAFLAKPFGLRSLHTLVRALVPEDGAPLSSAA